MTVRDMPLKDEQDVCFSLDRISLFLDLDGTVASFAGRPADVVADPVRNTLLRDLAVHLEGRLAVVSGRAIEDIDRILGQSVLAVAGSHGLERRNANLDRMAECAHAGLRRTIRELHAFADGYEGVLIEEKPLSVAFHYRGNPSFEPVAQAFAQDLASRTGLILLQGAMVVEFLTPGMDKGKALHAFMAESPFSGTVPIFVGDDLTDESGFKAAREHGGLGILVGPPRPTFASYRLATVADVLNWLQTGLSSNVFRMEDAIEPSYRRF